MQEKCSVNSILKNPY